jgi:LmbE family N-acetylglucosaminyl deacetylase
MMKFNFPAAHGRPVEVLCLGAHSDDLEIGCGGTILTLLSGVSPVHVHWVVLGASGHRGNEARESARRFLSGAQSAEVEVKEFRDSFFPYIGGEIKEYFEELKHTVSPDLVFTHCRHDLHQDHRLVSELTWNTFRNHIILEYEIIKYDADLGSPNFFVHVTEERARKKVKHILDVFKTQGSRSWFTETAFMSIMRIRGLESNAPGSYAEGFYCRKLVIDWEMEAAPGKEDS